ncbi:hypothetical protein RZR97_06445 [Hydrogenimonas thermophila]|uniref:hypothetical protein n=1 Tax=Hydrogenimonas thermophila TaxID=223786 RepID=UPI00293742EA|nr:hypothetical protein [Hydrogenimonas thermophila]WOE68756.1 hypothetical protein RZR91_06465 [Hydrogenimonas thermophila]WOE71266.1 hypothetical protein RZR97_06445 [Hydrogenimonas thermophila]
MDKELFEKIILSTPSEKEDFEHFLNNLVITCIQEGKHLVSISKNILPIIEKMEFLSDPIKKKLMAITSPKYGISNFQSLIEFIQPTDIIIITKDDLTIDESENIVYRYIPYKYFLDSSHWQKTSIVGEHISNDIKVYKNLFTKYYQTVHKLKFPYYFDNRHGGGSPIKEVLEDFCQEEDKSFHLFLVDGDRESPQKSGMGSTAKGINNSYKKCQQSKKVNHYKSKLKILEVKELENLIPIHWFEEKDNEFYKTYRLLLSEDISIFKFFDIKKGVYCANSSKNIKKIEECDLECNKPMKYYCEKAKKMKIDFFKINLSENKILETFLNDFEDNIDDLVKLIDDCNIEEVKILWNNLGRVLYSWGIGFEKQRI